MEFSLQAALCRNPSAEVGSSAFKLPLLLCRLKSELHATLRIGSEFRYGVQPSGCTVPEPNCRSWDLSLQAAPASVQAKA